MGSALRKIQFGKEATAGTKVAATVKMMGALTMEEKLALHRPDEERGSLADVHRTLVTGEDVDMSFEGDFTFEQAMHFLAMGIEQKKEGDTSTPSEAKYDDNGAYTDLANAIDDSTSTYVTIAAFVAAEDKLLVGYTGKFRAIKIDMGSVVNAETSTVTVKCSDGASGWLACTLVQDTTLSGGASLAQDGVMEFTPHASWASDTIDGDDEYWISLEFSANLTASIRINELYVITETVTWTFDPSWTSANTPQSYTIEYGDDVQEYEVEYCVARAIEISGSMDDTVKLKADIFGRNMAASTFTSLSDPSSITPATANKTKLYIDATGGTIGSTEKSSTLVDYGWKFETGLGPSKHGGANSYFDTVSEKKKKLTVSMTIVFNSGAEAERLIWVAGTRRLFRLEVTGSSPNKLTLDFAGVYTSWSSLEDRDGEDVVKVTIEGEYDSTDALYAKAVVTNQVGSLL